MSSFTRGLEAACLWSFLKFGCASLLFEGKYQNYILRDWGDNSVDKAQPCKLEDLSLITRTYIKILAVMTPSCLEQLENKEQRIPGVWRPFTQICRHACTHTRTPNIPIKKTNQNNKRDILQTQGPLQDKWNWNYQMTKTEMGFQHDTWVVICSMGCTGVQEALTWA